MKKICKNCHDDFVTNQRTKKFCTNICYKVFRNRYKTQADLRDGSILRTMWKQYHAKRNNYDDIIAMMYNEKFYNNKSETIKEEIPLEWQY